MSIGENIKSFRESKGLTQAQLAEQLGVDQSYIAKVEKSVRSPTVMFVEATAKTMGCTLDELLGYGTPTGTA